MKLSFDYLYEKILKFKASGEYIQASIIILREIFKDAEKECGFSFEFKKTDNGALFVSGPCGKNVVVYCKDFDPSSKVCQECCIRPTEEG